MEGITLFVQLAGEGVEGKGGLVVLAGNRPQVGNTWCWPIDRAKSGGASLLHSSIGFRFIFGRFMTQCKIREGASLGLMFIFR